MSCKPGFYEEVHGPDFQGLQQLDADPSVTPVHHELVHHLPLSHHQPLHRKDSSQPTHHKQPQPHQQTPNIQEKKQEFLILSPVLNHAYNTVQYAPEPDNFLYHGGGDLTTHEHENPTVEVTTSDSTSPAPKLFKDSTYPPLPDIGPTYKYHPTFLKNNQYPSFNDFHLSVPVFNL